MRWSCCAAILLSACYAPALPGGAPCKLTTNSCPTGQACVAMGTGSDGVCMADHGRIVDAGDDGAAPPPADAGPCVGGMTLTSKFFGSVCLSTVPTAPLSLGGATTINTANVAGGGCTQLVPQTAGPSLCILAGTTIDIPASATVRAVGLVPIGSPATGTNPLVLVATQSITIEGTLDVSSHSNETVGGAPALGAGARTPAGCFATGVDGTAGSGSNGGAGAAGGTFGTSGALGGNGNNSNTGRGTPLVATAPKIVIGGCPGGHGGDGGGGMPSGGAGGNAGGAVYLFAGASIAIAGKVNASGAGGVGGVEGNTSSGGGGGGGAGGLIALEAAQVSVASTGTLFANGGGGGAGAGNIGDGSDNGKPGADPTAAATVAKGGTGTAGGGNGGSGSVGSTAPTAANNGGNPNNMGPQAAGGGGGGGAGVIRVFGPTPSSIGGTVSPPAT